jgi:hypothetical protein
MTHRHGIWITHRLQMCDSGLLKRQWNVTPAEAIEIQDRLSPPVIPEDQLLRSGLSVVWMCISTGTAARR